MKRWTLLALGLFSTSLFAANAQKPHPHQGVLKPYVELPPLSFTDADKARLMSGKPVMRQTEGESGGRGLAIFHVAAPPRLVWEVINDFPRYPEWIEGVKRVEVYRRDGGRIDVDFTLGGFGFSARYFIRHDYHHDALWGTWTLDYARESDLDDSVGFWRVTPWGNGESLVEYSVDVQVRGWLPGFIRGLFVNRGLKGATEWVKVQSEARAAKLTRPSAGP